VVFVVRRFRKKVSRLSRYAIVAHQYLQHAEELWATADFDTAVRDDVAKGLAYIVRAAYDCQALDAGLQGLAFVNFIDQKTAEWFRRREFSEWFCIAAACGFNSSRPRELKDWRFEPRTYLRRRAKTKTTPGRTNKRKPTAKKPTEAKK
jgi:hypothetical protein